MSRKIDRLAVFKELHGPNFKEIVNGATYMRLVADTTNKSNCHAVLCFIEGLPIGYLYNALANYFQPQILRINSHGLDLIMRCKVSTKQLSVHFRSLEEEHLNAWVTEELARHPKSAIECSSLTISCADAVAESLNHRDRCALRLRIESKADWLRAQTWFLPEDLPYADRFGFALIAYTETGGLLEDTSLSLQEEQSLLAVAYGLHRSSAEGISYMDTVKVGDDDLGNPVYSQYIGISSSTLLIWAVLAAEYWERAFSLVLEGDDDSLTRYYMKLSRKGLV